MPSQAPLQQAYEADGLCSSNIVAELQILQKDCLLLASLPEWELQCSTSTALQHASTVQLGDLGSGIDLAAWFALLHLTLGGHEQ